MWFGSCRAVSSSYPCSGGQTPQPGLVIPAKSLNIQWDFSQLVPGGISLLSTVGWGEQLGKFLLPQPCPGSRGELSCLGTAPEIQGNPAIPIFQADGDTSGSIAGEFLPQTCCPREAEGREAVGTAAVVPGPCSQVLPGNSSIGNPNPASSTKIHGPGGAGTGQNLLHHQELGQILLHRSFFSFPPRQETLNNTFPQGRSCWWI